MRYRAITTGPIIGLIRMNNKSSYLGLSQSRLNIGLEDSECLHLILAIPSNTADLIWVNISNMILRPSQMLTQSPSMPINHL